MCLSTVYKNNMAEANIAMKNVMRIECHEDSVVLTDLMDRTMTIQGQLLEANLVDGFVIVKETA
jgi:predicted RNA-binding protein